jgi:RNA polymerase sigma-70 factor (ECF subfamily)
MEKRAFVFNDLFNHWNAAPARATRPRLVWSNPSFPSAMSGPDEYSRAILAVAGSRDRESFRVLFLYFAPRVKGYLMRRGMSAGQADELAQETMLMVWRKAGQFNPERAAASTWIFTIARNLRIDQLRRGVALPDDYYPGEEPVASPGDDYFAQQRDRKVSAALKSLPQDQAEVVRLSFFEEIPHPAIAAQLGIPLGTVKSRLRLAMSRLRKGLEEIR